MSVTVETADGRTIITDGGVSAIVEVWPKGAFERVRFGFELGAGLAFGFGFAAGVCIGLAHVLKAMF